MKILAFGASASKKSINKQLVMHATSILRTDIKPDAEIEVINLNDYEMPIFNVDREAENGVPREAKDFFEKIATADALLISFAEHNGSYTAAYKNIFDWASRIEAKVYQGKPAIVLSTSPGARGGASVLETVLNIAPYQGLEIQGHLSIGNFYSVFEDGTLTDPNVSKTLTTTLKRLF